MDNFHIQDACTATVTRNAISGEGYQTGGYYVVECFGADGQSKWKDDIKNLVTTVGLNLTVSTILGNTAAGAVYMGLKGTGTPSAGDTQASHATWNEVGGTNAPAYTGNRQTPTFGSASGGVIATSTPVVFAMTSSGTVAGCFINIGGSATKDDTTGTLFSVGDFTAGSKIVTNGDTLSVSYQLTAA